ncbi:Stb3 [Kluyveromyces lactis]|nr:Stb3 [Kluyveromyces lactis]
MTEPQEVKHTANSEYGTGIPVVAEQKDGKTVSKHIGKVNSPVMKNEGSTMSQRQISKYDVDQSISRVVSPTSGVSPTRQVPTDYQSNAKKMTFTHKPISTTSPEAQQAAQQVTPEKLSQLLLEKGPLAIRFITKALSKEIPKFADLSASKQRRLITSALESGDEINSVVFAKIGWGQWSAAKVEDPADFVKQRELTNIANSKIKDQMASERRRSSGAGVIAPTAMSPVYGKYLVDTGNSRSTSKNAIGNADSTAGAVGTAATAQLPLKVAKAGSAATSTFLDENVLVSDDDEEDDNRYYDDDDEEEFNSYRLNQDGFRRRQSSVISDNNSPPNELEMAVRTKLKNGSRSGSRSIQRQRHSQTSSNKKRSSSVTKPYRSSFASLTHSNGSETLLSDPSLRRMSTHSDHRNKSIVHLSGSETENEFISHITSSRRESRLSFTNESSIRSTLASHLHKQNHSQEQENDIHSDTDEEDWQAIGAETLREHGSSPTSASPRDQDAAIALMSLKS